MPDRRQEQQDWGQLATAIQSKLNIYSGGCKVLTWTRQTLVTHDPVQYTHMAYLPFPSSWPYFTPKDKIGDWFEAYASLMELNVWMNTRVQSAEFNDETGEWLVQVERGGEPIRKLKPRHLIMCTGEFVSLRAATAFPRKSGH